MASKCCGQKSYYNSVARVLLCGSVIFHKLIRWTLDYRAIDDLFLNTYFTYQSRKGIDALTVMIEEYHVGFSKIYVPGIVHS